jgi:putative FmdB family regulatory protein
MPIFEFECLECGARFEKLIRTAGVDAEVTCPKCRGSRVEEKFSTFSSAATGGSAVPSNGCVPGGG